jgi:hypothetical protein
MIVARAVFASALVLAALAWTTARADSPAGRFVTTAGTSADTGTVYDGKTKLTWQQSSTTAYTWAAGKTYCAGAGASLGGSGWRLPSMKELMTIIDYTYSQFKLGRTFDPSFKTASSLYQFWSATVVTGESQTNPTRAWFVDATDGANGRQDPSNAYGVRCVR